MSERCQRCGHESEDLRALLIDCMAKLTETGLPFKVYDHIASDGRKFYALRICKLCRSSFINSLTAWFSCE